MATLFDSLTDYSEYMWTAHIRIRLRPHMPCPYDDKILLTNALLVPLSLLRHRSGNPPTSSCRAAQVLATEGYKTGVGAVSRCVPRCTWYCKYGRFVGTGSYWGNSSVVERWIPDPAVGGSIPSSLMRYSFTGAVSVRVEHLYTQATLSCTIFICSEYESACRTMQQKCDTSRFMRVILAQGPC